jgi:hypothetical protein
MPKHRKFWCWIPAIESESKAEVYWSSGAQQAASSRVADHWLGNHELGTVLVHTRDAHDVKRFFSIEMSIEERALRSYGKSGRRFKTVSQEVDEAGGPLPSLIKDSPEDGAPYRYEHARERKAGTAEQVYWVWCEDWASEQEAIEVLAPNEGFAACRYLLGQADQVSVGDEFVCLVRDPHGDVHRIKTFPVLHAERLQEGGC